MKTYKCEKCGSSNTEIEEKGNQTGLYCCDCGKWIKWLSKEEVRVFLANQNNPRENDAEKKIIEKTLSELLEIVTFHSVEIEERYFDGETRTAKYVSLEEVKKAISIIKDANGIAEV